MFVPKLSAETQKTKTQSRLLSQKKTVIDHSLSVYKRSSKRDNPYS